MNRSPLGYSLVEVLAVLLLLGLLATAAGLRLHGVGRRAQVQDVLAGLAQQDRLLREQAQRFGRPAPLIVAMRPHGRDSLRVLDRQDQPRSVLTLPAGFKLAELRLGTQRYASGEVSITCSPAGCTRTYALKVQGPEQARWVLVAGLSGQVTYLDDQEKLDNLWAALEAPGDDAD